MGSGQASFSYNAWGREQVYDAVERQREASEKGELLRRLLRPAADSASEDLHPAELVIGEREDWRLAVRWKRRADAPDHCVGLISPSGVTSTLRA